MIHAPRAGVPALLLLAVLTLSAMPAWAMSFNFSGSGCTTEEQNAITGALTRATSWTAGAVSLLAGYENALKIAPNSEAEYNTWFGTYAGTRFATATDVLGKVNTALSGGDTYVALCKDSAPDCEVDDDAYSEYGVKEIGFCNEWFNNGDTGFDSKAGGIIHEMTHIQSDTEDHAYTLTDAKALATDDPDKAVDNADNYEFFVEQFNP